MSSGRSSAPSGRSGPEPLLDVRGKQPPQSGAVSREPGTTSQPVSDLPGPSKRSRSSGGRAPFDASERGLFWPEVSARPWQRPARASESFDPRGEQISGAEAARRAEQAAQQPTGRPTAQPVPDWQRPTGQMTARRSAARVTARIPTTSDSSESDDDRSSERPDERSRTQTLTQQIRSVQPPDVARQAVNELSVLAGELITLAQDLEQSGLARMHARAYFATAQRYSELARLAWLSVAAERLEQDGASQDYRQRVIIIARDITRLRRESDVAASNEQFPLPRRRPYLWRLRADVIRRGLGAWQATLSAPADPRRMGQALFELRGALNMANVAPVEFSLLNLLTIAALTLTPLSGLAAGMASIAGAFVHDPLVSASYALVTLLVFMLWAILLLLTSRGRVTLVESLAGICFSASRSACNGRGGSRFVALALRAWWLLIGGVGALLTIAALTGSFLALGHLSALASLTHGLAPSPVVALRQAAALLALFAAPAATVATAALVALAAPALLVSAIRLAMEMAGSRRWVPAARRYALGPALATLSYVTGALVALAWLLGDHWGLPHQMLLTGASVSGRLAPLISERAPLLAIALALPYLALIEAPFRLGLRAWRSVWLRDLNARRTTIEAHVRRLSAPDPHTGVADTSDETLRAMQYDLVLLQFYSARITEAESASSSPFGRRGALILLAIVVAGALLLDGGAHALAQALIIRLTP